MSLNHKEVIEALLAGKVLVEADLKYENRYKLRLNDSQGIVESYEHTTDTWNPLDDDDFTFCSWKIAPETININGHEVPKPLTECVIGDIVYLPGLDREDLVIRGTWYKTEAMDEYLHRGLLHSTKEGAIAHARALLSFTEAAT